MAEPDSVSKKEGRTHIGRFYKWYLLGVILIGIAVVASVLLPKAVAAYGKYVGQTPEEAVQKYFEDKHPEYASDDAPLLVEQCDEFTVVLYDISVQFGQSPVVFSQMVRRNLAGWYIDKPNGQGRWLSILSWGELGSYIEWDIGRGTSPGYTVICGKTVSDEVASVEVDYRYGRQTKRVAVQDEWFFIVLETVEWNDTIRALDAEGNVLAEWFRYESLYEALN